MTFTASEDCAQGSVFTFGGTTFKATSISFTQTANVTDISDLSIAAGGFRKYAPACLVDKGECSVDFIGSDLPSVGSEGAIAFAAAGVSGNAVCKSASLTCAVGELIKGQASFMLMDA